MPGSFVFKIQISNVFLSLKFKHRLKCMSCVYSSSNRKFYPLQIMTENFPFNIVAGREIRQKPLSRTITFQRGRDPSNFMSNGFKWRSLELRTIIEKCFVEVSASSTPTMSNLHKTDLGDGNPRNRESYDSYLIQCGLRWGDNISPGMYGTV